MKYLSVCSGIEAATVAWHGLGWQPVAFAEIEPFPAAVLAHHYPTVPNLGDLTKYREWPEELLAQVDLLVGGTPCQAFSVAGKRQSLDDERGNLSLVYVNLYHHINEVRKRHGRPPAIALWENVPGVLSTKDNAFGCFIGGLLGCDEAPQTESGKWDKAGFLSSETVRVGYRVLDAQYFGVAQRRRRVFLVAVPCELVASLGERACPSEILSLRESVLGNPPTRGAAWEGVARATAAGVASGGRGVAGTLDSNYHKVCGERAGVEREVVIDAPPVCGTLSDGAHMGGGLTGRTHTRAESCPCVARTLTQRMHKGFDSTLDLQTPIVTHGGVFDGEPTCFHHTQNPISSEDGLTHALGTGLSGGCAPAAVAYDILGTLATNGAKSTDVHTALRGRTPGQSEASTTTVVAFTTEQTPKFKEDCALTMTKQSPSGGGQPQCVAFANRTRNGVKVPEVMQGGVVPALTNPGGGGRSDAVNVAVPASGVDFQNCSTTGEVRGTLMGEAQKKGGEAGHGVMMPMAVRRLTPTECAYLQGFPADYLDVTFRKKPAADGPRYRALGNSMAVPCMWWLGYRIDKATRRDNT